jgi:hypothetical protein
MSFPVTVSDLAPPVGSRVVFQFAVSADFNISAEVARQRANRFLIMNLGDQLHAGVPELVIGEHLAWRVPVHLALSRGGYLGKIGDLRIDAQTGDLEVEPPQSLAQMANHAEVLYERAALSPRTADVFLPIYQATNLPITDSDSYRRTVACLIHC